MRTIVAALALATLLAGAAMAEDAVVIEGAASRQNLVPGSVFSTDDAITLAGGERLHVLLQSGAMIELTGPFQGRIAVLATDGGAGADPIGTVAALLIGRRGTTSVLGASRESATPGASLAEPDVWLIATDASGVRCVDGSPRLWRRDASSEVTVVARGPRGATGPTRWPAGETTLPLPPTLSSEGPLEVSVGDVTRRYELRPIPAGRDLAEAGHLLVWFAEEGCVDQAGLLLERLRAD